VHYRDLDSVEHEQAVDELHDVCAATVRSAVGDH
jgi:hypothetical protein